MAVERITHVDWYHALSTDPKPAQVTPGSRLWETNTGDTFIYVKDVGWVAAPVGDTAPVSPIFSPVG